LCKIYWSVLKTLQFLILCAKYENPSSNFHRSYKTIFAYISHTNHRFCIGTLTYNALLPELCHKQVL
jgi:hypothetical protein